MILYHFMDYIYHNKSYILSYSICYIIIDKHHSLDTPEYWSPLRPDKLAVYSSLATLYIVMSYKLYRRHRFSLEPMHILFSITMLGKCHLRGYSQVSGFDKYRVFHNEDTKFYF